MKENEFVHVFVFVLKIAGFPLQKDLEFFCILEAN